MDKKITGIVDVPLKNNEEDKLKMQSFEKALYQFIENAETPITIALQGEWGCGKTSLLNRLEDNLCNSDNTFFYSIWLNTWHFSLLKNDENVYIEIISSLIDQVISITKKEHPEKLKRAINDVYKVGKSIFRGITKIAMKTAVSQLSEQAAGDIENTFFSENSSNNFNLNDLRNKLSELVRQVILKNEEKGLSKKAFLFFIDDLDRIEPKSAVKILELLKNIFDIENCIFILAVDYEVIVKGLKHKFGELTVANEREFRSFFDKIIQLPFQMPVQSYFIDDFLTDSLLNVGVISEQEAKNDTFVKNISSFAGMSVGTNPRSIKRLVNTLSFVNLLVKSKNELIDEKQEMTLFKKTILFALASFQVAFPSILDLLSSNTDFENWTFETLNIDYNNQENIDIPENYLSTDWQKILFVFCSKSPHLKKHFFNILNTFKLMQQIADENKSELNDALSQTIDYLSATSVKPELQPKIEINNIRVLYAINQLLLPELEKKIISPMQFVKRKGRMIAKLSYIFDEKSIPISIFIQVKQNNIILKIGFKLKLFEYNHADENYLKYIEGIGKIEEFNKIIANFEDILERNKVFRFANKPKNSLGNNKKSLYLEQYFQYVTKNVESIYSRKNIDSLSDLIIDLAKEVYEIEKIVWFKQKR